MEEEEETQFQSFLLHHIHQLQNQPTQPMPSTPKKQKTVAAAAGKIVPVPGGHIVQATGRKDRHSKVCTAKGLRDRRVRLSAHTAIEFYDVQDRLGYDRPSMAVDWLMKNAKAAIDELDELPPWQPTIESAAVRQAVTGIAAEPAAVESFFPMASTSSYPPDLLSRTSSHVQDLRLSLHPSPNLFSFDPSSAGDSSSVGGWWPQPQQPQFFTQRGPLQSSITSPSVPSWTDSMASPFDPSSSSIPSFDYGHGQGGGYSGFRMPSWIQGEEEHGGDASGKPSS